MKFVICALLVLLTAASYHDLGEVATGSDDNDYSYSYYDNANSEGDSNSTSSDSDDNSVIYCNGGPGTDDFCRAQMNDQGACCFKLWLNNVPSNLTDTESAIL